MTVSISNQAQPLSNTMRDLLSNTWDMPESSHDRVVLLQDLMILWDATYKIGWHEHTADWDWRVTVTMTDGTQHGTYETEEDCEKWSWGDTIMFDPEEMAAANADVANFTACVDHMKIHHLVIEEFRYPADGEAHLVTVPIANIKSIQYGEA